MKKENALTQIRPRMRCCYSILPVVHLLHNVKSCLAFSFVIDNQQVPPSRVLFLELSVKQRSFFFLLPPYFFNWPFVTAFSSYQLNVPQTKDDGKRRL
ncbi:Uncharacterized protein APZ42_026338 [Daphnia magna]|uniref:Uncharacterized protein n=1 Tax=Daphnia magna TaxID=35525 RepID=A0A0P5ZSX8_9CRUS|nr:Uncharacterized protein APZ42_026338 [Daphnia magna]